MAANQRSNLQQRWPVAPPPAADHIASADSSHREVLSPAVQLQARVGAALASPDNAFAIEPVIDKWPAPIRMTIVLGGGTMCWFLLWETLKFLF